MSVDIATISPAETIDLDIEHPGNGEPLGLVFTLAGPNHQARKRARAVVEKFIIDYAKKRGQNALPPTAKMRPVNVDFAARCTLGWKQLDNEGAWKPTMTYEGEELPYSLENAKMLFGDEARTWLFTQVHQKLTDAEDFFKA